MKTNKNHILSIIIPLYNEEKTIAKLISRVVNVKFPKGIESEIIVVDDGSFDRSVSRLAEIRSRNNIANLKIIKHEVNRGKGAAVRTGIKKSTGDIIIIQDADLEYDPEDYNLLIKPIIDGKEKVVYGSRLKEYPLKLFGKKATPLPLHYIANRLLSFLTNVLYGSGLTDMETCYKVFDKNVLRGVTLRSNRFDFEPEFTAKILKRKYKIVEIPIKSKPRGYGEGKKITWKDGFVAVWILIKYRFID